MTEAQNNALHGHLQQIQQHLDAAFRLAERDDRDDPAKYTKLLDEQTLQTAPAPSGPTDLLDLAWEAIGSISPHALTSAALYHETERNYL